MASTGVSYSAAVTARTGNEITVSGQIFTFTGANTVAITALGSAVAFDAQVVGDIHGMLRFQFADPDTLEGALAPSDLRTAQIKLTQGGADAVLALLAEEVYGY